MQDKILSILRHQHEYLSGEEIAERLKISRQALWKQIQELKDAGYEISAVPHLGYRLEALPDRLYPPEVSAGLSTKFIGRKIFYFDSLASTMDKAWELGRQKAAEGTLVLAETQTRGRGRLGRQWASAKHKGIYLSLILRPKISASEASLLTLLAAVSVCEAVAEEAGLRPQIKWPNDILLNQKKVGGILTELNAETDEVHFVVLGIGVNVNNDSASLPSAATSLREEARCQISRLGLLQALLRRIEENYVAFLKQGSGTLIRKWREHNLTLGRRVRIISHRQHLEGMAVDIDHDGGLLLRQDSGLTQKVMAGDITSCR
jgi:BirA family biotin operon repressor/biotin-[acetyl-CoA-carboxylase] ligase